MTGRIDCGDCVGIMGDMEAGSADLVAMSSPYDDLRTYEGHVFDFARAATELCRVIRNGGRTLAGFLQGLHFQKVGSGTTCKMARKLRRNHIGIAVSPKHVAVLKRRVGFPTSPEGAALLRKGGQAGLEGAA